MKVKDRKAGCWRVGGGKAGGGRVTSENSGSTNPAW